MKFTRIISITAAALLAVSVSASAANFTDIKGHWAEATINALADKGVINGVSATSFNPEGVVTRAEFLKMAMEASDIQKTDARSGECLDAKTGDWYAPYLQSALDKGLVPAEMIGNYGVKVTSDTDSAGNITSKAVYSGRFYASLPITREEMASIAQITYQYSLNANTMQQMINPVEPTFSDKEEIAEWSVQNVKLACAQGFIKGMGDGTFSPKSTATRAQAAEIISRVLAKKGN